MGCYGIGPARIMTAAVEQRHDEARHRMAARAGALRCSASSRSDGRSRGGKAQAEQAWSSASRLRGLPGPARRPRPATRREVRRRRPDRLSLRVTVGKKTLDDGTVDVHVRDGGEEERVELGRSWSVLRAAQARCSPSSGSRLLMAHKRRFSDRALRRGGDGTDGREGRHVSRPCREDGPLRRLPQPSRSRQPPGSLRRGDRHARGCARRRARALPRVPHPCHHGEARGDAEARRSSLPPPRLA